MPSSDTDTNSHSDNANVTEAANSDDTSNTQTVAVETETVPSVPILNVSSSANDTIKSRKSQDSIPRATIARGTSRKRNLRLAQGSKADIFAAKVANAVEENNNSSEDEESFVYDTNGRPSLPHSNLSSDYLRAPPNMRTKSHSSLHHQIKQSPASNIEDLFPDNNHSAPSGQISSPASPSRGSIHRGQQPRNFVVPKPAHKSSKSSNMYKNDSIEENAEESNNKDMAWPKLLHQSQRISRSRNLFNEAPSPLKEQSDSVRAKNKYLQKWRTSNMNSSDSQPTEDTQLLRSHPSFYNSNSVTSFGRRRPDMQLQDPEILDEEDLDYLYGGYSEESNSRSTRNKISVAFFVIILLFAGFVIGFFVAAIRPLSNFEVLSLSDVLVSDRELYFSLIMHARNPSLFSTLVQYADLDIFATSSHVSIESAKKTVRTVLLGSVNELDTPVLFRGGFNSAMQWKSAAVKLVDPLATNKTVWTDITEHEFDITVKGSLVYSIYGKNYTNYVSRSYKVPAPELIESLI